MTASCSPPVFTPSPAPNTPRLPPDVGRTRLVERNDDAAAYTGNRETDARTALTRGLKEYLEQISYENLGRFVRFEKVFDTWAMPDEGARFPSACVYATGPGVYDAARFTPAVPGRNQLKLPDGRFIMAACDYTLDMLVAIWATDIEERMALVMALEDKLNPLEYMYGLKLELPHYFNARAVYELISATYDDTEDNAIRNYRQATLVLRGRVAVGRALALPMAKIRPEVTVQEEAL